VTCVREAHEHHERLRGVRVEQPELLVQRVKLRVVQAIDQADVLAAVDVRPESVELEPLVVAQVATVDVDPLPALAFSAGLGEPGEPWLGSCRPLRLSRQVRQLIFTARDARRGHRYPSLRHPSMLIDLMAELYRRGSIDETIDVGRYCVA
jgi:hypothetical protein